MKRIVSFLTVTLFLFSQVASTEAAFYSAQSRLRTKAGRSAADGGQSLVYSLRQALTGESLTPGQALPTPRVSPAETVQDGARRVASADVVTLIQNLRNQPPSATFYQDLVKGMRRGVITLQPMSDPMEFLGWKKVDLPIKPRRADDVAQLIDHLGVKFILNEWTLNARRPGSGGIAPTQKKGNLLIVGPNTRDHLQDGVRTDRSSFSSGFGAKYGTIYDSDGTIKLDFQSFEVYEHPTLPYRVAIVDGYVLATDDPRNVPYPMRKDPYLFEKPFEPIVPVDATRGRAVTKVVDELKARGTQEVTLLVSDGTGDLKEVSYKVGTPQELKQFKRALLGEAVVPIGKRVAESLIGSIIGASYYAAPDPHTLMIDPFNPRRMMMMAEVLSTNGKPFQNDTRFRMRQFLQKTWRDHGLIPVIGLEPEWFLVERDENGNPHPLDTNFYFDRFQNHPAEVQSILLEALVSHLAVGINVANTTSEVAGSQHEWVIEAKFPPKKVDPAAKRLPYHALSALRTLDDFMIYKYILKKTAALHGVEVSFEAKPFGGVNGSGMHTHLSFHKPEKNGTLTNLFAARAANGEVILSKIGQSAAEGIMRAGRTMFAFTNQNRADMFRHVAGFEAPDKVGFFSEQNRSAPIRRPKTTSEQGARFEYRVPAPDDNMYLNTGTVLSAALAGMLQGLEMRPPVVGQNVYHITDEELKKHLPPDVALIEAKIPESFEVALQLAKGSLEGEGVMLGGKTVMQQLLDQGYLTKQLANDFLSGRLQQFASPLRNPYPFPQEATAHDGGLKEGKLVVDLKEGKLGRITHLTKSRSIGLIRSVEVQFLDHDGTRQTYFDESKLVVVEKGGDFKVGGWAVSLKEEKLGTVTDVALDRKGKAQKVTVTYPDGSKVEYTSPNKQLAGIPAAAQDGATKRAIVRRVQEAIVQSSSRQDLRPEMIGENQTLQALGVIKAGLLSEALTERFPGLSYTQFDEALSEGEVGIINVLHRSETTMGKIVERVEQAVNAGDAKVVSRIAINGAGRIGMNLLRAWLQDPEGREIVALNDIAFRFDKNGVGALKDYASVLRDEFEASPRSKAQDVVIEYGKDGEGTNPYWLSFDGRRVTVTDNPDPAKLPWSNLDIDFALEATGVFTTAEAAEKHHQAGARHVIITAPAKGNLQTIAPGVNSDTVNSEGVVYSCASCTTNAIASPLKVMHDTFDIEEFYMDTTHAYTSDQSLLDTLRPGKQLRGRAAADNIVPSSTGAASAIGEVIPELAGKGHGIALRVPVVDGSIVGVQMLVSKPTTKEEVNRVLREAAEGPLKGRMAYEERDLVSKSILGRSESSIIDGTLTHVGKSGKLVTIWAWYDNEFGYANRVLDLANIIEGVEATRDVAKDGDTRADLAKRLEGRLLDGLISGPWSPEGPSNERSAQIHVLTVDQGWPQEIIGVTKDGTMIPGIKGVYKGNGRYHLQGAFSELKNPFHDLFADAGLAPRLQTAKSDDGLALDGGTAVAGFLDTGPVQISNVLSEEIPGLALNPLGRSIFQPGATGTIGVHEKALDNLTIAKKIEQLAQDFDLHGAEVRFALISDSGASEQEIVQSVAKASNGAVNLKGAFKTALVGITHPKDIALELEERGFDLLEVIAPQEIVDAYKRSGLALYASLVSANPQQGEPGIANGAVQLQKMVELFNLSRTEKEALLLEGGLGFTVEIGRFNESIESFDAYYRANRGA